MKGVRSSEGVEEGTNEERKDGDVEARFLCRIYERRFE